MQHPLKLMGPWLKVVGQAVTWPFFSTRKVPRLRMPRV